MLCLFQLPVQFWNLGQTRRHSIQGTGRLEGFCCNDDKVYCVEWQDNTYWLTLYDISSAEDGSLTLLDKVKMGKRLYFARPRVDYSHRVYVPCDRYGVRVFLCQGGRLLPARDPLRCARHAWSVCVNTADTVFVCDWDTKSVCLVNVSSDTVIRRLERPVQVRGYPYHVSVLGQTVLVCYIDVNLVTTLVTYHSDSPTPGQVLQTPEGLEYVTSITTDTQASIFLVTGDHSVFVLDDKLIWHRIYTGEHHICDGSMVQSQLWLGHYFTDITVLTSQ